MARLYGPRPKKRSSNPAPGSLVESTRKRIVASDKRSRLRKALDHHRMQSLAQQKKRVGGRGLELETSKAHLVKHYKNMRKLFGSKALRDQLKKSAGV